jgi:hypothetical protein
LFGEETDHTKAVAGDCISVADNIKQKVIHKPEPLKFALTVFGEASYARGIGWFTAWLGSV